MVLSYALGNKTSIKSILNQLIFQNVIRTPMQLHPLHGLSTCKPYIHLVILLRKHLTRTFILNWQYTVFEA